MNDSAMKWHYEKKVNHMPSLKWLSEHVNTIYISDAERCCATCAHYYPHYVKDTLGRFIPISIGHCIYPRTKARRAQGVCEHYAAKEDGRTKI